MLVRTTKFLNTQLLTELISYLCLVVRFEHNFTVTKPSSDLHSPYSAIRPLIRSSCQCYSLIISSRPVLWESLAWPEYMHWSSLGHSFLTFGLEFHMYTCMHTFARLIASHHTVKVHDVTSEHCAPCTIKSPIYSRAGPKVSTDCPKVHAYSSKASLKKTGFL